MANTVKRLNYYDHQFLRAPDFTDEQSYHLNMRRLHNSSLHTWGIVQGLGVTATSGGTGTAVTVSAGFALDSTGRELVLPADQNLELGGQAAGTTLFITITYNEQQSDPTTEAGGPGNTRITELPNLSFSPTAPADNSTTLILARVPRTATGLGTIDLSNRKQAGVVLGSDLTVNTLTLKKDGVAQANWPVLSCSGANQAALANSNLNLDAQREIFFTDNGQIRSFDQNHKIAFNRSQNLLELYEFGDVRVLTGSGLTEKFRIQAGGNVGIGTAAPKEQLHVEAGSVYLNGESNGVIVDAQGSERVGFMKYPGKEGMLIGDSQLATPVRLGRFTGGTIKSPTKISEDLVINSTGNVGVGTSAPTASMEVLGTSWNQHLKLTNTAEAGAGPGIFFNAAKRNWAILATNTTAGAGEQNLGFYDATSNVYRLAIDANGKLHSSMWQVTQVMNQVQGALPKSGNFNSGGGTLMIIFSGSGFAGGASNIGITLQIDGVNRATTRSFTNEPNSHKAFTTNILVQPGIPAGNHTITLQPLAGTATDFNDWFNVTVLELPF